MIKVMVYTPTASPSTLRPHGPMTMSTAPAITIMISQKTMAIATVPIPMIQDTTLAGNQTTARMGILARGSTPTTTDTILTPRSKNIKSKRKKIPRKKNLPSTSGRKPS